MTTIAWMQQMLEYLGGARDEPPAGFPVAPGDWWFWALWWGLMALAILVFSGQSSKFIYIDF